MQEGMAGMQSRQGEKPNAGLSGADRGAIEEFLIYIEEWVKDVEPVCAKLVHMARLALKDPDALQDPDRFLH